MDLISVPNQYYQNDTATVISLLKPSANIWTTGNDEAQNGVFVQRGKDLPLESFAFEHWQTLNPVKNNVSTYITVGRESFLGYNELPSGKFSVICVMSLDVFLFDKCAQRQSDLMEFANTILQKSFNILIIKFTCALKNIYTGYLIIYTGYQKLM